MPMGKSSESKSYKSNKSSKSKSNKFSKRKPTKPKPELVKAIKNVIKQSSELKFAMQNFIADKVEITGMGLNYNGTSNLNGWCSGASNGYGIIPAVEQGSGEGNRIGVRISPKGMFLRYSLLARSTTDNTTAINDNPFRGVPFRVRVIVFRHLYAQDDYSQNNICDIGNGNASITGDIDTLFRPYNKEEYKILYSKTHKMYSVRHIGSTGYNTENVPNYSHTYINQKVNIKLPKVLRYNDTVITNYPSNEAYFLAVAVVNEDGTTITTSQKRVLMSAESGMYYADL